MKLFVFGSSLTSSYWNGAATYYRGMYKNLAALGHQVTFAEPDICGRQQHRDADDIDYARVIVYRAGTLDPVVPQRSRGVLQLQLIGPEGEGAQPRLSDLLAEAAMADLVIKHSGVGADDEALERRVLDCRSPQTRVVFWDVDAPATLARLEADASDPFHRLIPDYDYVLTYGGGPPVVDRYLRRGARHCYPIYNGLDPETHFPVAPDPELACDLAFVGHRLPDRERRVEDFFLRAARLAPELRFILGGEGWGGKALPENVRWIGHVATDDHNRVNSSARMVLNLNRDSMAAVGFSPPTRVFEAAGAGACVITDAWAGIECFFRPGLDILVADSAEQIVNWLRTTTPKQAQNLGRNMRLRALSEHTYALRAAEADRLLLAAAPPFAKLRRIA